MSVDIPLSTSSDPIYVIEFAENIWPYFFVPSLKNISLPDVKVLFAISKNLLSCLFAKLSVSQPDAPSPVKPFLSLERSGR